MKQPLKNEMEMLSLINKIQEQLMVLNKKVDTLIYRSLPEVKPSATPPVDSARLAVKPNEHNKGRVMHAAICADCKKECSIPFKPSGDRPVYCQECFSRRKAANILKIPVEIKPQEVPPAQIAINKTVETPKPQAKSKKKAVAVKKPVAKKKTVPKKK